MLAQQRDANFTLPKFQQRARDLISNFNQRYLDFQKTRALLSCIESTKRMDADAKRRLKEAVRQATTPSGKEILVDVAYQLVKDDVKFDEAECPKYVDMFQTTGLIELLVEAARESTKEDVLHHAMVVLWRISRADENKEPMLLFPGLVDVAIARAGAGSDGVREAAL